MKLLPVNAHVDEIDQPLFDRELSWLAFNDRVLELAGDPAVPLIERMKFCAIFSSNLDEFFQVRVAGLRDKLLVLADADPDGAQATAQTLRSISERVVTMCARQQAVLADIVRALSAEGVSILSVADLDDADRTWVREYYRDRIFPVLTPLAVDPGHPFPYISNLSLNLAVTIRDQRTGRALFARVKVPPSLPRFVALPGTHRFVRLEDLIAAEAASLFPGLTIEATHPFRVTRDADIDLDGADAEDLLVEVESKLRRRRFGAAVRLEIVADAPQSTIDLLVGELDLTAYDVTRTSSWLALGALWALARLDLPHLKYEPWTPVIPKRLAGVHGADMFAAIRHGDVLVHHPYESFTGSVERFIAEAAVDPQVVAIKLTLYRTSGDGQIVDSLIRAVADGKQVAVLIEVTARFDEQANIAWARKLEEAGVHVAHGVVGFKTHTKVALVVRSEADGLRRYCHVATGNYNASTADIYEDVGLFSCEPVLGDDLTKLFNGLTGYGTPVEYQRLLVAPARLRPRMLELIRNEMPTADRGPGRIVMKMNSLVDPEMIGALYEVSQAGVEVELVIRGICCLRPGVPGMSENIRVRSIVGRYLEHSRIYRFSNGRGNGQPLWLLGSADMMQRNLDHRVEAVVDVVDPALSGRVDQVLGVLLDRRVSCWELDGSGTWHRRPVDRSDAIDPHRALQHMILDERD